MTEYKDERRAFVDEMRAETLNERELNAMTAIVDGECSLDRLSQMFDWDGFTERAADILNAALAAESAEEIGDYERARADASEFCDDAIAEYLGREPEAR